MRAPLQTFRRARRMRRDLTRSELRLWLALRGRALAGLKFRNQHPIGPYILDFYCPAASLAVEVDGDTHLTNEQQAHDRRRDAWMARQGILTLRVPDMAVMGDLWRVLEVIAEAALPRLKPAPPGGATPRRAGPTP